jgi:hypothetical protein
MRFPNRIPWSRRPGSSRLGVWERGRGTYPARFRPIRSRRKGRTLMADSPSPVVARTPETTLPALPASPASPARSLVDAIDELMEYVESRFTWNPDERRIWTPEEQQRLIALDGKIGGLLTVVAGGRIVYQKPELDQYASWRTDCTGLNVSFRKREMAVLAYCNQNWNIKVRSLRLESAGTVRPIPICRNERHSAVPSGLAAAMMGRSWP